MIATHEKLTTAAACQQAGMNRERLLRRVQAGEIAGELVFGRWVIDKASLEAFIERCQPEPAPAGWTRPERENPA